MNTRSGIGYSKENTKPLICSVDLGMIWAMAFQFSDDNTSGLYACYGASIHLQRYLRKP